MFVIKETLRGNVTQLGECWPCLHEALGSDSSTAETGWSVLIYDSSAGQVEEDPKFKVIVAVGTRTVPRAPRI